MSEHTTRRTALAVLMALLLPIRRARAQADPTELKAVFLFNFAQFVEWPASAFPSSESPLVIGILGADPFGNVLDEVFRNQRARNRRLALRRFKELDEAETCHIMYVSRSEQGQLDRLLLTLRRKPVLTVGEIDDFAARGGIIQLITERKVRLRINLSAAKAAGLTISAKMLQLAEVI